MSELHPISDICKDPQRKESRRADVVFVHGRAGGHVLTWRHGGQTKHSAPHRNASVPLREIVGSERKTFPKRGRAIAPTIRNGKTTGACARKIRRPDSLA